MTHGQEYREGLAGAMAPHIPAEVYRRAGSGNSAVVPSAIIPPASVSVPAGMVRLWAPDGREVWIDTTAIAAESAPVARPAIPRWAVTAAVLMPSAAGSLALGAWGLSMAAAAFAAIAAALWALFLALLGLAVLLGVVSTLRPRRRGSSGPVTATATATARGLFGRATSTATARKS